MNLTEEKALDYHGLLRERHGAIVNSKKREEEEEREGREWERVWVREEERRTGEGGSARHTAIWLDCDTVLSCTQMPWERGVEGGEGGEREGKEGREREVHVLKTQSGVKNERNVRMREREREKEEREGEREREREREAKPTLNIEVVN